MKSFFNALILFIACLLIYSCEVFEFPESPYPKVSTLEVIDVTESGAIFQADFFKQGELPIIDHGFVWGFTKNLLIDSDEKIRLGKLEHTGKFERKIGYGLYPDTTYFVRAFILSERYFVYGDPVTFRSKGGTHPVISSFYPEEGTWGDTVKIKGTSFSTNIQRTKVRFGQHEAKLVSAIDTLIVCIVPEDIAEQTVPVSITVVNTQVVAKDEFSLTKPHIESFIPLQATFDDIITIHGRNFDPVKEKNLVKFDDHNAIVLEASTSQLKVKVPLALKTKESIIRVTRNLQTGSANTKFNILAPVVSDISVNKAYRGATVNISGDNFSPEISGNAVSFSGALAKVLSASRNQLMVEVPEGIYKSRSFNIEVKVAEQSAFSGSTFTLLNAWIRKADPPINFANVSFAINGKGYIGFGFGSAGNKLWRYDPLDNTWTEVAPFPGGLRGEPVSFVIDDIAYVGLGIENKKDFWKYDASKNQWTRIADLPFDDEGESFYLTGIGLSANGKGYVALEKEDNNFYEYSPANNVWTLKQDHPGTGGHGGAVYNRPSAGFTVGSRMFLHVTITSLDNPLFEYNFVLNEWETRAATDTDYNENRNTGFTLRGFGYIAEPYMLRKYDHVIDSWEIFEVDVLDGREGSKAFVIGNKLYIGLAWGGLSDFWEYDMDYD